MDLFLPNAKAPNALAVAAPFSTMDAKVRTASAAAGESFERDKLFEDCDTGMGMLLMLWFQANILLHARSILFCPLIVPKSAPGTALCREIADFTPEAPRPWPR